MNWKCVALKQKENFIKSYLFYTSSFLSRINNLSETQIE